MVQAFETTEIESVLFLAKVKASPSSFTINVDSSPTNLALVDELKMYKGINSAIDLGILFTLSVSDADKLILEELMMIVKYKF